VKQINPLYIALLLIAALVVVTLKLDRAQELQKQSVAALQESESTAKRIVALQKEWDDGKASRAKFDRILDAAPLRGIDFNRQNKADRIIISAETIEKRAADYLLNKLLNGAFVIKSLKLRRLDDRQASLQLEVTL